MLGGIINALKNYANFTGRAGRTEFWSFTLLFGLITVGAHFIDAGDGQIVPVAAGMGILELATFLLLLLPAITTGARRLHDTGRSGWWLCTLYIPYLAFVASTGNHQLEIASAAALLLGTIILLIQLMLPGEKSENRFGPIPTPNAKSE
jgi:uncharacterized membrane protein YhaH (DUF805 family)